MAAALLTESIGNFKDLMMGIAAYVGMLVAILGLTTWNRQLKGGVEYELARRLLKQTYRLRDAIRHARPSMTLIEPAQGAEGEPRLSRAEAEYRGTVKFYQTLWDRVTEVHSDLKAELLEGEVVWSSDIHEKFQPLFALEHELYSAIRRQLVILNPSTNPETKEVYVSSHAKKREVMYDLSDIDRDEFSDDVRDAIVVIENYIKPHLAT